jgi:hypothetical protein
MRLGDLKISALVATSAGLCGLWQPQRFLDVTELETFEDEVADNAALERHIRAGAFVPINVGGDGAFQVELRGVEGPGRLSSRERTYRLVSSEPYLLISEGSVELGGLEAVGGYSGADKTEASLDPGRYAVVVHLIEWEAEPGSRDEHGEPTASALPDFIVEIFEERPGELTYRSKVRTFERP